ncbi:MAG: TIGR03936 family radical SAM-associated protein [Oscillospiraceae bacterium]
MQNLRIHFSKTGDARYISHLDISRCFSRAIRKSGIDVWYTEGFNSRIYMTFALPLSLGVESTCETMDIKVKGDSWALDAGDRLAGCLPRGIEVFNCTEAIQKPTDIAYAKYLIELCDDALTTGEICAAAKEVLASAAIITEKRTKKGAMNLIDIKPHIKEYGVCEKLGKCYIELILDASMSFSLNPQLVLDLIFQALDAEPKHCLIRRTNILMADMKNFE